MVFDSKIELRKAFADDPEDYYATYDQLVEQDEMHRYPCYEVVDNDDILVIDQEAPSNVQTEVENIWKDEHDGTEVVYPSDPRVNQTEIKEPVAIKEPPARPGFYIDNPPKYQFEQIAVHKAEKILENRGISSEKRASAIEKAWYYPTLNEVVSIFDFKDEEGETMPSVFRSSNLTEEEQQIIEYGKVLEGDDEEDQPSIEELQEEIYQNSLYSNSEAKILACLQLGITDYEEISDAIGENYSYVTEAYYRLVEKAEKHYWAHQNIHGHLPKDDRPDQFDELED